MRPLLIGIGNPDRGDDALGIELVSRLEQRGEARCDLLCAAQLEPELVLDMHGRALALIVDASHVAPPPCRLGRISPRTATGVFTHSLGAGALLGLYRQQFGDGPACFLLEVRGEDFTLGSPLSAAATEHLQRALLLVDELLHSPDQRTWSAHCTA